MRRQDGCTRPSGSTSTSTARTTCAWPVRARSWASTLTREPPSVAGTSDRSGMRRRPEAYHETLREHKAERHHATGGGDGGTPASIHDIVMVKETGLAKQLFYDPFERRSGLVRFLPLDTTPETWATAAATELGDAVESPYEVARLTTDRLIATREATVAVAV